MAAALSMEGKCAVVRGGILWVMLRNVFSVLMHFDGVFFLLLAVFRSLIT